MINKKESVAMLLAGGQGSRLYALTNRIAKPAVSYGGKYRIIDFPLSNCVNSGIDTVGVLTQYQPLVLNDYIGNGEPWDLDRSYGGVHILSPYQAKHGQEWYKGTANAIYQNISFIKSYKPEYVLILSGDHIYKMNYAKMISAHKKTGAACTIAAIKVPLSEASRFGIINVKENGEIYEFEEKPKQPKSDLASMGIYVFSADKLYEYLEADEADENSSKDFGKDVLPKMLAAGEKMFAYTFKGYWKDVGTINSLFESNMDLLNRDSELDINDPTWKIRSRNPIAPPQYIGENGRVVNSVVVSGCEIEGDVENSILSHDVTIRKGAVVRNSIIFSGADIGEGAKIDYAIIDENVKIGKNASVGEQNSEGKISVIGRDVVVSDGAKVPAGEITDKDV
ncbi:MAG TPA: glucose-1-phosphate adenylyltransferase [Clostridiales bacterium]|nr:glucose-1-phosphate adenylyltransferase [Clostridiales bacterium]